MEFDEGYKDHLLIICMLKLFHDAGNDYFERAYRDEGVNDEDYYYEYIVEAIDCLAPIVESPDKLYDKYRLDEGEDNIFSYSSKEMQKYFKIARKLYRINGCKEKQNPYIERIYRKVEEIRNFESYCFDYHFGSLKKHPQLEVMWNYEFTCEIYMCLWILRVIEIFKVELPILIEEYKRAKRL
ncbi:MAG: hypothetical protein K5768_10380, partial [Firmicutes bacterium]|nr:hypothetical protein [Bacillota bacterium]